MSFFDLFKRKPGNINHDLDDNDRELAQEVRRAKTEISKQRKELELEIMRLKYERERLQLQAQIEDIKENLGYYDDEPETLANPDNIITSLLTNIIQSQKIAPSQSFSAGESPPTKDIIPPSNSDLSDADIINILNKVPNKYLKIARKMNDNELSLFIKNYLPNIDDEKTKRIISFIRK